MNDSWITANSGSEINFVLTSNYGLLMLHHLGSKAVIAYRGTLRNKQELTDVLKKMLSMSPLKELGSSGSWECKVIATDADQSWCDSIRSSYQQFKFSILKVVQKPVGTEIRYFPGTGRLQAASQTAEIPAMAVTRPPFKVLIVDDSKTIRNLLARILSSDSGIEVVGLAEKPSDALALIPQLKPDVITLDIHMPEMDGVTLLKKYLPQYPIPTIMISSITMTEGPMVLNALEAGAVDYIQKPSFEQLGEMGPMIVEKVKSAAVARLKKSQTSRAISSEVLGPYQPDLSYIVAIGSSTGGTEALREVLTRLPEQIPPVVVVQHIPAVFSKALADRLNSLCAFEVKEAEDGDELRPGRVLIAPGGTQMAVVKRGEKLSVRVNDDAPVNRHKPSVDYMFDSIVKIAPKKLVGVIMTGMGADGAKGLLALRNIGARTVAQNEETCVVYGMPREAVKINAAEKISPLEKISDDIMNFTNALKQKKAG